MMRYTVFVVDDEEVAREGVALALQKDYHVRAFASAEAVLDAIQQTPPDLVLLDIGLPGISGIEALESIKERFPEIIVIMITAYEDVMTVINAMKRGAYDYMVKPLKIDALKTTVQVALETISMRKEIQLLHEKFLKENMPCFIGESNAIQDVMEVVEKVAQSPDTSVLIVGETGTGKELIARAIHFRSPLFKGPMISVNCAAIPKDLIESELFGYEKGAFSGADAKGKEGLVEKAADGTLFLDEVGDLSAEAQAKLLRFLEEGEYYRVGGTQKRIVRTRVVSATNRDLPAMTETGDFRNDLYYRLAVVKLEIPSLNERRDDIIPIAKHFLLEYGAKFGKNFTGISSDAQDALKAFHWSGNVRELKNIIERGALFAQGPELDLEHLELKASAGIAVHSADQSGIQMPSLSEKGVNLPELLATVEKQYFDRALALTGNNESKAARLLTLSRDKFRYRRNKLYK
jgi:DNA-binding NtrC family response regulator